MYVIFFSCSSQETCMSKLFPLDRKAQTMPAMRCNRASLMQTKMQQFSTMEASLTLNIGGHTQTHSHLFLCKTCSCNDHILTMEENEYNTIK